MKNKLNFITKSFLIKTFAVLMIIGMMDSLAFSQTRIRFAKGKSSATVSGTCLEDDGRNYIVGARQGQYLLVRLDANSSMSVTVDGILADDNNNGLFELQTNGDHEISVYNSSRPAKYSLYVEIR